MGSFLQGAKGFVSHLLHAHHLQPATQLDKDDPKSWAMGILRKRVIENPARLKKIYVFKAQNGSVEELKSIRNKFGLPEPPSDPSEDSAFDADELFSFLE